MAKLTEPDIETVNPVSDTNETLNENEQPQPRKRGRPKGSKNGTKTETPKKRTSTQDKAAIAQQLFGVHQVVAMVTSMPEVAISEPESLMLADALQNVCAEYGLSLTGKTGAAIQLIGAAGMIYIPRALAIDARLRKERAHSNDVMDADFTPAGNNDGAATH